MRRIFFLSFVILFSLTVFVSAGFNTQSSVSSTTYQYRPGFQTYYSQNDINTYWPILGDKQTCESRQDVLLQVAPGGCQPAVVRSDLLADQNVPVFCQIDALQLNPLLDIKSIKNIRFSGTYPKDIVGAGFHPAQAAIRTRDTLLGDPLINNIGYVVVVLKKNEIEKTLPDSISVNLSAQVEYDAGNAFGIGRAEFILKPVSEEDWTATKNENSFWRGRYFLRLDEVTPNYAVVSIYNGDQRVSTVKAERGKPSQVIYMPGLYCRAGVQVSYDGFVSSQTKARIEVGDNNGLDSIDVYEGSSFLNGACSVSRITKDKFSDSGNVTVSCSGGNRFTLSLKPRFEDLYSIFEGATPGILGDNGQIADKSVSNTGKFYGVKISTGTYAIDSNSQLYVLDGSSFKLVNIDPNNADIGAKMQLALKQFRSTLQPGKDGKADFLKDQVLDGDVETKFNDAIENFKRVAIDYPAEKAKDNTESIPYGEAALFEAYNLAKSTGKKELTAETILTQLVNQYPDSPNIESYKNDLRKYYTLDSSLGGKSILINNVYKNINLLSVSEPADGDKSSADFSVSYENKLSPDLSIKEKSYSVPFTGFGDLDSIKLDRVLDDDSVFIRAYCKKSAVVINPSGDKDKRTDLASSTYTVRVGDNAIEVCNKVEVKLNSINFQKTAKVSLIPFAKDSKTQTNLSINIGIEKRAIKLSPDKALETISALNSSIAKWESISKSLGKVVTGLKTACFATTAVLTAKNFISGVDGTSLARQQAMRGDNGWTSKCKKMIDAGTYKTLTECYNAQSVNIEKDVSTRAEVLNKVNKQIQENEKGLTTGDLVSGYSVDNLAARNKLVTELKNDPQFKEDKFVQELKVATSKDPTAASYSDVRDWYNNKLLASKGIDVSKEITSLEKRVSDNQKSILQNQAAIQSGGLVSYTTNSNARDLTNGRLYDIEIKDSIIRVGGIIVSQSTGLSDYLLSHNNVASGALINGLASKDKNAIRSDYLLVGVKDGSVLNPELLYSYKFTSTKDASGNTVNSISLTSSDSNINQFKDSNNINLIKDPASGSLRNNKIASSDRVVRYFETGPDKGLPAVVPFDVKNGWYTKIKSNLRIGNAIAAYDASGLPKSWWICNVGENGQVDETSDECQQVIAGINTRVNVLGLGDDESKSLIDRSQQAILQAASQKGSQRINILGQEFYQGAPATPFDNVQCQDFMSADDCKLLFNVCDPVICPATRCNLGGAYPVADVIQTGIVGSALLCLPNAREGVLVPVCLTGIQAGIDGFVSILKNHRDCLQESVSSGKMVGICDEIYSIYLCEFFWRQVAPVANIILPKLVEFAYGGGQGARGGGEYLTVMGAWENTQKSIDYFTQVYAANSFKAFNIRSVEEAGGQFCKGFISAKGPSSFKTLVEPDSPPQFHAYFDATPFTTATLPATSQYKVFYHIFAGNDAGVYFNVYLKSPPEAGYYRTTATLQVASGFIKKGGYSSETKDFIAPEGYKELCVRINNEEECGFKQVSTSFAVNTLADQSIAGEIAKTDINSESQCISGSTNLGALLQPNIQSGVEEAALPQVSERGVVRICGTKNPGASTDPARYVNVGNCGDSSITCWLDKQSVNNAITDSNVGLKNQTLSDFSAKQQAELFARDGALSQDVAAGSINDLRRDFDLFKNKYGSKSSSSVQSTGDELLIKIDAAFGSDLNRLVLNHQKADVMLMKAKIRAVIASSYLNGINVGVYSNTQEQVSAPVNQKVKTGYSLQVNSNGFDFIDSTNNQLPIKAVKDPNNVNQYRVLVGSNEVGQLVPDNGSYILHIFSKDSSISDVSKALNDLDGTHIIITDGFGFYN